MLPGLEPAPVDPLERLPHLFLHRGGRPQEVPRPSQLRHQELQLVAGQWVRLQAGVQLQLAAVGRRPADYVPAVAQQGDWMLHGVPHGGGAASMPE